MKSAYIHIPFCRKICSYCDFCKVIYNEKIVNSYLEQLSREVTQNYKNDKLETIYIGGGTPSSLTMNQLKMLFEITSKFILCNDYEFTFELNIEDITEEKLILLLKNGVNRLSIGVQTINSKFYNLLNRKNNINTIKESIELCKKYFKNINVDFMYGFNGETLNDLDNDLNFFLSLDVSHISIYSLILEKNTKLYVDHYQEIDDELESLMYNKIIEKLKEYGFIHYEISNFGKIGCFSRHNLRYWNNEEYYGFGAGSSGYISNMRYSNTRSVTNYINGNYIYEVEKLTKKDIMQYEMICGLRKVNGVSKKSFYNKFDIDIHDAFEVDNLIKDGLLSENDENIFIPEDKLYVSNSILISFLD